ncbi:MAG: PQQ-binding-like beta-propeller repeat protein, partial [Anaerolineae bacterium]|nr:PQQ-binding-like beta-propeller repeat protein [Anaerolineae bacterium]
LVVGDMLLVATQSSGTQSKHCTLYALELSNGEVRWKHNFAYTLVNGMQAYFLHAEQVEIAVVAMGSSDILKGEGGIRAFNQAGEVVWEWQGSAQQYSAPLVRDRQVYVTAGAKQLVVISPEEDGDVERRFSLDIRASLAAPAIKDGVAYIPCRAPKMMAVKLSGTVCWQFETQTKKRDHLNKTPLVTDEIIYTVSDTGSLFAINRWTGLLEWKNDVGNGRSLSELAMFNGHLYVGARTGLYAINAQNGKIEWHFETDRAISGKPLVVQDKILATCENHFLYALDRMTGEEEWHVEMERRIEVPPVLSANALIIADRGGTIMALERPFFAEAAQPTPEEVAITSESQKEAKIAAAQKHQDNGEHERAAETWYELGELDKAAEQFELAKKWDKAAELWQQQDSYYKRANAYQKYAEQISEQEIEDEKKAVAWEQAARAYAETGQKGERIHCETEVARYRQQPIIKIEIKPEPLFINAWSDFFVHVKNVGFGVARFVSVTPKSDRFESQSGKTLTTPTLTNNRDFEFWFVVRPKEHGTRVPIQLMVEYMDKEDQAHKLERTFFVKVDIEAPLPITKPTDISLIVPQTGQLAEIETPEGIDLAELYKKIIKVFTREELTTVMFELNLREDNFDSRLNIMTKQLLLYLLRNKQLNELIDLLKVARPNEQWD